MNRPNFEKIISFDYTNKRDISREKFEKDINLFFNSLLEWGYPDQDSLIEAGILSKCIDETMDSWFYKKWNENNDPFNHATILWFFNGYWRKRNIFDEQATKFLLSVELDYNDKFGNRIALMYLLYYLWNKSYGDVKKDSEQLLRKNYSIYKSQNTNNNLQIDEIFKKYFN